MLPTFKPSILILIFDSMHTQKICALLSAWVRQEKEIPAVVGTLTPTPCLCTSCWMHLQIAVMSHGITKKAPKAKNALWEAIAKKCFHILWLTSTVLVDKRPLKIWAWGDVTEVFNLNLKMPSIKYNALILFPYCLTTQGCHYCPLLGISFLFLFPLRSLTSLIFCISVPEQWLQEMWAVTGGPFSISVITSLLQDWLGKQFLRPHKTHCIFYWQHLFIQRK